jgi:hypothetical protein
VIGTAVEDGGSTKTPSPSRAAALPPISPSAPTPDATTTRPCTSVLQYLPQRLDGLAPRVVHPHPDSPFVVAWGEPAIVFRCGVDRPADLAPQSSEQIFSANGTGGPYWLPVRGPKQTTWTVIDRAVYIELTVPNAYQQPALAPIGSAVLKGLPEAVCLPQAAVGQTPPPESQLCTRRK